MSLCTMAIQVVEFSSGGTKLERFLPKNQHAQRKLLNFENWVNGEKRKHNKRLLAKIYYSPQSKVGWRLEAGAKCL